jgi:flagellar biosynthesis protein FlhG
LALNGDRVKLSDYFGKPIVLETGSLTCPMYVRGIVQRTALAQHHPEVQFLVLCAVKAPKTRTIAVASGKGGVGKSVVTANLSICLAQQLSVQGESSVVALDMDLGCGNLNACLGVRSPNGSINRYLSNQESSLTKIMTSTEQSNLEMICSSYGGSPEIELSVDQKKNLMSVISSLPADFVLLDLGAGISCDVLDMFLASTDKVIVITPESLSLHNAFVFLETVILHYLWRELERQDVLSTVKQNWGQMIDDREHLDIRSLIERVKVWDRYAGFVLAGLIDELGIKFIVDRYRGGIENAHLRKFHRLLYKYLCMRSNISYLGFVHSDRDVLASTRALVPFCTRIPGQPGSQGPPENCQSANRRRGTG